MTNLASVEINQPILVTGAHRSGTTWIGKMLAAGNQAAYISEPLNVLHRPGVLRARFQHWYTYICRDNEDLYIQPLYETLTFRYHTWLELKSLRSFKDLLRMGRDWSNFLIARIADKRPLVKDPFAIFSIPWFIERWNCQVVVSIRHPAGFVSSLKRLGWSFDFNDFLQQPLLVRDWLTPYRQELEQLIKRDSDLIHGSSLLWRIIYEGLEILLERFPHIQVVRHEDLSTNPLAEYWRLYQHLSLNFNTRTEQAITRSSNPENPTELTKRKVHATTLDSLSNLNNWKRRLTTAEVEQVRRITEDIAAHYYPNLEWE